MKQKSSMQVGSLTQTTFFFAFLQAADINPSNIMLTIADETLLTDFERDETQHPSPTKIIDEHRTIYGSRKLGLLKDSLWGQPVLCDFGEARIGLQHKGIIQPAPYRAPEVLFNMEWTTSVDKWNVAVLVCFWNFPDAPMYPRPSVSQTCNPLTPDSDMGPFRKSTFVQRLGRRQQVLSNPSCR
jgi:serine/threonine protein kinase